jgi:hypothetical protein
LHIEAVRDSVAGGPSVAIVVLFASKRWSPADLALLRPATFDGVTVDPPDPDVV